MIPYSLLPNPTRFPYACVACMGTKGPFVATHRELPGYGDVYICAKCVTDAAVVADIVTRKDAEEKRDITTLSVQSEQEIAWRDERIAELTTKLDEERKAHAFTTEQLGESHGRVIQLEGSLAAQANAALELVGGEAA